MADEFVKEMDKRSISLELMADFLVMASTLLEIKSKMLLPKKEEEEEDPRLDLVAKILEYQKFQEIAGELKVLHEEESKSFYRKQEEFITTEDVSFIQDGKPEDLSLVFMKLLKKIVPKNEVTRTPLRPDVFPVS